MANLSISPMPACKTADGYSLRTFGSAASADFAIRAFLHIMEPIGDNHEAGWHCDLGPGPAFAEREPAFPQLAPERRSLLSSGKSKPL